MTKTATIQTEVESEIKDKVENIFRELGISTAEAINMFLYQVVRYGGIPLDLRIPNAETKIAMEETEEIIKKGESRFNAVDEMFEELEELWL